MLHEGKDPLDTRKVAKLAEAMAKARMMTFDQCAAAHRCPPWKLEERQTCQPMGKHSEHIRNPIIGPLPVADVDTALVVKVLSRSGKVRPRRQPDCAGALKAFWTGPP